MSTFEERRLYKLEKYQELSEKNRQKSEDLYKQSNRMTECIPMGQPILVGHHSEKADRNFRNKIHNTMGKSIKADKKADYYARRAKAIEQNKAIFSDDPEVTEKLAEKIERCEKALQTMKDFNKLLKKNDIEGMLDLGFTEQHINELLKPDFMGRVGFASYVITNAGANIRNLKKRLEIELKKASEETTEQVINGIKIVENVEENRVQMFFDGKPSEEIRTKLKSSGFRWSPYNGCWQRHRSNVATWISKEIAEKFGNE